MATGDERLAEMIREHQRLNEKWGELKAPLAARGHTPIAVPSETRARVRGAP